MLGSITTNEFTCGYCTKEVATQHGYSHNEGPKIYICPNCGLPTFTYKGFQSPGPAIGREIAGLSPDIQVVYKEIRDTAKNGSYTATVLLGRKLIMHIAVDAGAKEGETFQSYVDYLANQHYIPPKADKLLEYMRSLGNEKNHEIKLGTLDEVKKIVKFVESLLYFVYELDSEFDSEEL